LRPIGLFSLMLFPVQEELDFCMVNT
jgi:hypothetical protein